MRKLTFQIEGKEYPAWWDSPQDPTAQDFEDIEAGIRQKYGLTKPQQPIQPKAQIKTQTQIGAGQFKYVWGGDDPKDGGMDCSGLTCYLKKKEGIKIPRTAIDQFKGGDLVPTGDLQKGDLVFFDTGANQRSDNRLKTEYGTYHVSHVGIYLGDGKMMHQSSSKGKTAIVDFAKYREGAKFLGARRYGKAEASAPVPVSQPMGTSLIGSGIYDAKAAGQQLQATGQAQLQVKPKAGEVDIAEAMRRVDSAIGGRLTAKQKQIIQDWLTDVGGYRNITSGMIQTALSYAGKGQYQELVNRGKLHRDLPFNLEDLIAARRNGQKVLASKDGRPVELEYANEAVAKALGVPRAKLTGKMISPVLEDFVRAQELPFAPAELITAMNNGKQWVPSRKDGRDDPYSIKNAKEVMARVLGVPVGKLTTKMITRLAKADSLPPADLAHEDRMNPLAQAMADSMPDPKTDPMSFLLQVIPKGMQFQPDRLRDTVGQWIGLKPGEAFADPDTRDSQVAKLGDTVFAIGKYAVPYVGPAAFLSDLGGVAGRAREVGAGPAVSEFGAGMVQSMNFLEPGIGWGEKAGRLINAGLMGIGIRQGYKAAGKYVEKMGAVRGLKDAYGVSPSEAWQALKQAEVQALQLIDDLEKGRIKPEDLGKPQKLTEDLISPEHAQAVAKAALGHFEPASAAQMKAAFDANRAQVTLSDHSPEALGEMFTFKMKGREIYYALNPMESHWETGKPAVDITSVMNNEGGAPGVATPGVMLHAVESWLDLGGPAIGELTLDAWDVSGFLPRRYGRYGFKKYGESFYDVDAYGEPSPELKSAWKQDGWKEGDPFPSVVYMRYEGPTQPGSARRNYIETGTIDGSGMLESEPGFTAGILPDNERSGGAGRLGILPEGIERGEPTALRDSPSPTRSARGPLDSFSRAVRSLHDFSDAELIAQGIDPSEIRAVQPLPEQGTLPFNPEERAVLGIEALPEATDVANPELFGQSDAAIRGKIEGYGSKNVLVTKDKYQEAVDKLKDGLNKMSSGVDPTLLAEAGKIALFHAEAGLRSFADFVVELSNVIGKEAVDRLRDHLPAIWDQARLKAMNYRTPDSPPSHFDPLDGAVTDLVSKYKQALERHNVADGAGLVDEAGVAWDTATQIEGQILQELVRAEKGLSDTDLTRATRSWVRTVVEAQMQHAQSPDSLVKVLSEKFDLDKQQVTDIRNLLRANGDIINQIQSILQVGTPEQIRQYLDISTLADNPAFERAVNQLSVDDRVQFAKLQRKYQANTSSLLNRMLMSADRALVANTLALYKGFMLLGFKGPINNFLSNFLNSLALSASRPVRGGVDGFVSLFTGRRTRLGTPQNPVTGLRSTFNRKVYGQVRDALKGIDTEYTKYDMKRLPGMADGPGKVVAEMGFRLASAGDKPFYNLALERAMDELAHLQAKNEGLKGDDFTGRVEQLKANPTDAMALQAGLQADYAVLSNKNALADAIQRGKGELGKGGVASKAFGVMSEFILPFVKIPLNAAGRAAEFAGFGVLEGTWDLSKYVFQRIKTERQLQPITTTETFVPDPTLSPIEAGKKSMDWRFEKWDQKNTTVEGDVATKIETVPWSKVFNKKFLGEVLDMMPPDVQRKFADNIGNGITGIGLVTLGYLGYKKGLIQPLADGEPEDWAESQATGTTPGALRVGGYDIDLKSSVVGRILAAGATVAAYGEGKITNPDGEKDLIGTANRIISSVADNPLVQGTSVVNRITERPLQGLHDFAIQQAGTFGQPAFIREASRLVDASNPVIERGNVTDRWWSNVARGAQQPKTDVFGFVDETGYLENLTGAKANKPNLVANELRKLDITFTKPGMSKKNDAKYGADGGKDQRADMTTVDYADRVAFVGMKVWEELQRFMSDEGYPSIPKADKKLEIQSIMKAVRENAGNELNDLRLSLGKKAAHQEVWRLLRSHQDNK